MKNISSLCWIHWKFASRLPLCHYTLLEFSDHYLQEKMLNSLPTMIFHSSFKPFLLYILPILPHLYWLKDCQGYNWWSCCQWCEWKSTNSSNYSANVLYHFSMFQVSHLLIAEKNSITMAATRRTLAHFLKKKSFHVHRHSFIGSFIKIMITIKCLRRLGKTAEKVARRTHVASASLVAATALLYCVDMGRLAEGILKSGGSTLHCFDTLFQWLNSQKK